MTQKIIFLFILCGMLGINSCSHNYDSHTYYRFDNSDKDLIINYNYFVGQLITYENQFGEQLHFKVILNESKKLGDYTHNYPDTHSFLESYYDSKIIQFELVENESLEERELINYTFSKSKNIFSNAFNIPIWNVFSSSYIIEHYPINNSLYILNNSTKVQMNINGHLFQRVVKIDSGSNATVPGGVLINNVNKVYYDYDFGIIQFDDIDGKQWKVIYP